MTLVFIESICALCRVKIASKFDGIDVVLDEKTMSSDDVERRCRRRGRLTSKRSMASRHRGRERSTVGTWSTSSESSSQRLKSGRLKLVKNSSCWIVRSKTVPWMITFWKFPQKLLCG